jgi:Protein of unknown function (DUF1236)
MRLIVPATAALAGLCASAVADSGPQPGAASPAETVDTTQSTLLPPHKQALIRDFVRDHDRVPNAKDNLQRLDAVFAPGDTVPDTVELNALPDDTVTELPQITSYRFFKGKSGIVVVDPATRKVIQIIE